MVEICLVVREVGKLSVEFSLHFEVPEVPRVGEYVSIETHDIRPPYSMDVVVRKVWWRLKHAGDDSLGNLIEIFVECDTAVSPYSSPSWEKRKQIAAARGVEIEAFEVARMPPVPNLED